MMTKDTLGPILESLHLSLSQSPQLDESTTAKLKALVDEIQSVLAQNESSPSGSLIGRVQEFVSDFEDRHPQLTQSLAMVAERLSDMGI